ELLGPDRVRSDEDGKSVDECNAGVDRALCIVLGSVLGTDRQVADQNVNLGVLECLNNVNGLGVGLLDRLGVVLADPIEGRAPLNGHTSGWDVSQFNGVVLGSSDGLGQVEADLLRVNVE